MKKSIKVQLVPNNKQLTKFYMYSGAARFAYNWALAKEMESLSNGNGFISDGQLRKEFTQLKRTDEFKWLNDIDCDVTKQAIKDLCNAYKRFFTIRKRSGYKPYSAKILAHMKRIGKTPTFYQSKGHPKFKKKKDYEDYGFYQDVCKIKFTDTHVKLVLVSGKGKAGTRRSQIFCNVRLAEHNRIPTDCKHMNPRVTFDGLHWWLSVVIEVDNNINSRQSNVNQGVGIDIGVKDLAICSDGTTYKNINKSKVVKQLEKRKRRLQRSISRSYEMNKKGDSYCKTSNIIKKEKELLKLNHRLTNIRHDHLHKTTSEIIKREPSFICIEDLNISGMMKNKHLSKAVQQQCLYEFRRQIEYKSEWNNVPVIIADRFFPSSKLCNCCGAIKKDLKLSDRIYRCECGNVIDRDYQASLNLERYGEQSIA